MLKKSLLLLLIGIQHQIFSEGSLQALVERANQEIFSYLLEKHPEENIVISPLSISVALSMLYDGLSGSSRDQVESAFMLDQSSGRLKEKLAALLDKYNQPDINITASLGNAAFLNNGFTPKEEYVNNLEKNYAAEVRELDEIDDLAKVQAVNSWISNKTEGLIENLLSEGAINPDTQLLLLNVIYFYGAWRLPFSEGIPLNFYTDENRTSFVSADMMELEEDLYLVDEPERMKMVSLPYTEQNYSMLLFIPQQSYPIQQLAEEVFSSNYSIPELRSTATRTKVYLRMPKFDVTTKNSLVQALKSLNVTDMFDPKLADLSRISDADLHVSDILHSANIKVDENGSEAAAATSVFIDLRTGVSGPVINIDVDQPFLFAIVDDEGLPLFTGKIMNPTGDIPKEAEDSEEMEDKILLVHRSDPDVALDEDIEESNNSDEAIDESNDASNESEESDESSQAVQVTINCPRGTRNVEAKKFSDCEAECGQGPSYGSCVFQCWKTFCT